MDNSSNNNGLFKAYSLEIAILVAAILVSSTVYVSFSGLASTNQALLTQLRASPTAAVVAPSAAAVAQPSGPRVGEPIVIDTAGKSVRGDPNAPVTIVEFSDFQCPFCKRANPTVDQVLNDYAGRVNVVYMHYPLSFHEYAQKAAEGFECAKDQGKEWEYHDKIFNGDNSNIPVSVLKQYGQELGLDTARFNQCIDSGEKAGAISADMQAIESKFNQFPAWGLVDDFGNPAMGTPMFIINGVPLSGAQPYAAFKQAIDAALAA